MKIELSQEQRERLAAEIIFAAEFWVCSFLLYASIFIQSTISAWILASILLYKVICAYRNDYYFGSEEKKQDDGENN